MSNRGFSKIEWIIVVTLILLVIVIDIGVIWYLNIKQHDIEVLSDIKQIRSGLEVHLITNNYYPKADEVIELNNTYAGTEKLCLDGFKSLNLNCNKTILNPLPNSFLNQGNVYRYKSSTDYQNYQIEFILLTNFKDQNLKKGKNCATNNQIISQSCF